MSTIHACLIVNKFSRSKNIEHIYSDQSMTEFRMKGKSEINTLRTEERVSEKKDKVGTTSRVGLKSPWVKENSGFTRNGQ